MLRKIPQRAKYKKYLVRNLKRFCFTKMKVKNTIEPYQEKKHAK